MKLMARLVLFLWMAGMASSSPGAAEQLDGAKVRHAPGAARPGYLRPVQDAVFGSTVTRVTDPLRSITNLSGSWQNVARHHYSVSQAWNADQSLLLIDRGVAGRLVFLDGQTFEPVLDRRVGDVQCEWHPVEAPLMICMHDSQIYLWNVAKDSRRVVFSSTRFGDFDFGPGAGNASIRGKRVAVRARDKSGRLVAFVVNLDDGTALPEIDLSRLPGSNSYVSISPSGQFVFVYQHTDAGEQGLVYSPAGRRVQTWREHHRPGHGDMTIDADGNDVMVGISKSDPDRYAIIKRRLVDGKVTQLTGYSQATHVSARNTRKPGWVFVTYGGTEEEVRRNTDSEPFFQEVVALRIDGSGEIRRVAHTRTGDTGYLSEAHASPSPDGSKVIFASSWWNRPSAPIASYVAAVDW
ncbi:TolB-like translocation protein [Geminicoccus roseus]|uniref:WD40 repeat domain-containing protein n=1 Tax=Geminicoccus roseus TaxID=404900 RepID=UPI00054EE221|nr:WD40 repeat domain-containing protein [Geminicoccus roseus]